MGSDTGLQAADVVALVSGVVETAGRHLGATGDVDSNQLAAYDLGHAAAVVQAATSALDYGTKGVVERRIADAFVAEMVHDVAARVLGREPAWGIESGVFDDAMPFVRRHRSAEFLTTLSGETGDRHLDDDFEMVRETFHRFAAEKVRPVAEHVHRSNADIPEDVISGLAELGTFGLSIPQEYGGFSEGGEAEYLAMVVATEELSWGSLGVGGSLITRPEILTQALIHGATEEQKQHWLPRLASGEVMAAVAVTEPDFGSDSGAITTTATRDGDSGDFVINGVKTWCTFAGRADVLMLMARTDADRTKAHRGLSMFVVPKPRAAGHSFAFDQPTVGGWRGGRSTRSATAACTPSRSVSTVGGCRRTASSAVRRSSARASTCRW